MPTASCRGDTGVERPEPSRIDGEREGFGPARPYTVRWVHHYPVKEYARHLGHAGLLRERVDGAVGG